MAEWGICHACQSVIFRAYFQALVSFCVAGQNLQIFSMVHLTCKSLSPWSRRLW
ncbi:hypothetical protein LIPSTDRAFT_186758 [Lipomyces starkeyi NRRL Y-11557]|uniref:Uncharacterized protein n=1 Tax=Lipomyces starkeyi NRRL Y-11557 TaxID=675824 RepID=A0A1E3PXB7_LIPST|nr:hypothetical protein LIPSTDRAFT_186758 [Lipomyces starkeyi NRRL Y-11557]